MTTEAIKQDCESKAFDRLAEKLKKRFLRLQIIIVANGLYANTKVIKRCKSYGLDYLFRYKEGGASSIEECYQTTPEKNTAGKAEYINGFIFRKKTSMY